MADEYGIAEFMMKIIIFSVLFVLSPNNINMQIMFFCDVSHQLHDSDPGDLGMDG